MQCGYKQGLKSLVPAKWRLNRYQRRVAFKDSLEKTSLRWLAGPIIIEGKVVLFHRRGSEEIVEAFEAVFRL